MIYLFSENKIVINPYHKYFQAPKTSADFSTEVPIRRSFNFTTLTGLQGFEP